VINQEGDRTMRRLKTIAPVVAVVVLSVAACGGGGAAATPAANPTAAAAESQAAVAPSEVVPGAASLAPSDAPPAEPPAGGGTAVGVCELVTADELQGILGTSVSLTLFAGPPDTCDIQSTDGAPLAATVLTVMSNAAASAVFDAYAGSPGAQPISGMGDKAAFDPAQGVLVVLKADKVLTVAVFDDGSTDQTARLELMKQIATTASGRM
jgi:hypothetical protein